MCAVHGGNKAAEENDGDVNLIVNGWILEVGKDSRAKTAHASQAIKENDDE